MHAQIEDVMKAEDAFFLKAFRIIDSHQRTRWKHLYKILMDASKIHGRVEWDAFPGWDITSNKHKIPESEETLQTSYAEDSAHVKAILRVVNILLDIISTSDSTNYKFRAKLEKLAEYAFEVWAIRRTRNLQQVKDVEGFVFTEEDRLTATWKSVSDTLQHLVQANLTTSSINTSFFKFVKLTLKLFIVLVVFVICFDKMLFNL